jgi:hypothetical protein
MNPTGLLISWATPATSCPREDIFSLCTNCALGHLQFLQGLFQVPGPQTQLRFRGLQLFFRLFALDAQGNLIGHQPQGFQRSRR